MKSLVLIFSLVLISLTGFAQDSLLLSLQNDTANKESLLPQKMVFTQRIFWGENGLYRKLGWAPLTTEHREQEMRLRRKMLVTHQALGFVTLAEMVAQGIVGAKLYNKQANGQYVGNLKNVHEGLASAVNITYTLTALMALTAPPPLLNRDKGITSIRLHKWLAVAHITGMIATNVLAGQIERHPNLKPLHRAAAYGTFATFAAAVIVIKF
jgi:cytochrome b561